MTDIAPLLAVRTALRESEYAERDGDLTLAQSRAEYALAMLHGWISVLMVEQMRRAKG